MSENKTTGHQEKPLHSNGNSLVYKAFHEVCLTKDLGPQRNQELIEFIAQHIIEFKGESEAKHGIPQMLFERAQDAQQFANELTAKLHIPKEHITVKARKFTR
jgi:hypothetical protein